MATPDIKDIFEKGRSFQVDEGGPKYYIVPPEAEDIKKADWHYSKVYNKAFIDGVATIAEMRDALIDRGLIGEKFESKMTELQIELNSLLDAMNSESNDDIKKELAIKVAQQRDKILSWNQRASSPLSQTCESISDDSRIEFLTSCMVVNEDGSRVWKTYDDFVKEPNQALAIQARYSCMLFIQGSDDNFFDTLPENQVLRQLAETDEANEANEEPAEVVEEKPEKKPKPKKSKKKDNS